MQTGSPYRGGSAAWVAPAARADGTTAVLKVTWPHREARHEHTGSSHWHATTCWPDTEIDRRYRLFSDVVGEPVERLLAWTLARCVESALWEGSVGRPARGVRDMAQPAAAGRVLQQ